MIKIIEDISTKAGLTKCIDDAVTAIMQFSFDDAEPFNEYDVDCIASYFKLMLNYRSGNLTEKEMQTGLRNIEPVFTTIKSGVFTSVWGDGTEIVTNCTYNLQTGEVVAEVSDSLPESDATLEEEYIDVVMNGKSVRKEVCPECHSYVMKNNSRNDCGHITYWTECPDCGNYVE